MVGTDTLTWPRNQMAEQPNRMAERPNGPFWNRPSSTLKGQFLNITKTMGDLDCDLIPYTFLILEVDCQLRIAVVLVSHVTGSGQTLTN